MGTEIRILTTTQEGEMSVMSGMNLYELLEMVRDVEHEMYSATTVSELVSLKNQKEAIEAEIGRRG
jgi:hypothetical protein